MNKKINWQKLCLVGFLSISVNNPPCCFSADNLPGQEHLKYSLRPYVNKSQQSDQSKDVDTDSDEGNKDNTEATDSTIDEAKADLNAPIAQTAPAPASSIPISSSTKAAIPPSTPAKLLHGQVVYTVPSGTPIKLKLATVPTHPLKMMNHDLEGNLYPARLGQEITARTSEDIFVKNNKVIPEGTIFAGHVSEIRPPRRVGRPGSLILSFDQLITPDGRKFAFRVDADNRKASTFRTKAKGFGIISYYAFGGAVVGAIVAYDICGMEKTIAMHGYNIAAGAAAGALIATGYAIMRHGPKATLEPGDDLNMVIDEDLIMPAALADANTNKPITPDLGLKLEVEKSKIVNDGLDEHFITVDFTATNEGDQDLSSVDLFLEDTNNERHPLVQCPDEKSQFLFHIEPHSSQHLHVSFLTPYPKLKQQLVWLDHETRIVLAAQKL